MLISVAERSAASPRITHLSWGRIEVEGQAEPLKDVKLFPGGARDWDWNETGTRHVPGIQPADVTKLLEHGVHVVVLSRGMYRRLRVRPETVRLPIITLNTEDSTLNSDDPLSHFH